jgi:hypothetical protein
VPTVRAEARAMDNDRFEEPVRSPRPHRLASKVLSCHVPEGSWLAQMLELTVVCSATDPVVVQTPALAFTVLCSVFKERRAHGGTPKRSCGGAVSCPWRPAGRPIHLWAGASRAPERGRSKRRENLTRSPRNVNLLPEKILDGCSRSGAREAETRGIPRVHVSATTRWKLRLPLRSTT